MTSLVGTFYSPRVNVLDFFLPSDRRGTVDMVPFDGKPNSAVVRQFVFPPASTAAIQRGNSHALKTQRVHTSTVAGRNDPGLVAKAVSRRNRRGRVGAKSGNNLVGRRGKLSCDQCRRRKSKCVYGLPESPCEFCRSHNFSPCVKRYGPKTEAMLIPSKSIPVYDRSIPSQDAASLHFLYSCDSEILCGSVKLGVLARLLARVYNPSIMHEGLRHMLIAFLMSKSGGRATSTCPTQSEQRHVDVVFGELRQKLSNPMDVDESDIFVAYLLAIWSGDIDPAAREIHLRGVVAMMGHISRKMGRAAFLASPMAPFWALLRDEVLFLARKSVNCNRLCQDFRDILGPKTMQQRQQYENELRGAMMPRFQFSVPKVFYGRSMHSSVHTLMEAARIVNQRSPLQSTSQDPLIESVLVELHVEQILLEQKGHELLLDLELRELNDGEYVKDWRTEATIIERLHDLIGLYVCQITTIALEAESVLQGLCSSDGIKAAMSLLSIIRRARSFVLAGIKDERVFGTGLGNAYESYRTYRNWPCKLLLEAVLRNAPGEPFLCETTKSLDTLAHDFARFQEIYIQRGMTELTPNELAWSCFSPSKLTTTPSAPSKRRTSQTCTIDKIIVNRI